MCADIKRQKRVFGIFPSGRNITNNITQPTHPLSRCSAEDNIWFVLNFLKSFHCFPAEMNANAFVFKREICSAYIKKPWAVWDFIYCYLHIKVIISLNWSLIGNTRVKRKGCLPVTAASFTLKHSEAFCGIDCKSQRRSLLQHRPDKRWNETTEAILGQYEIEISQLYCNKVTEVK